MLEDKDISLREKIKYFTQRGERGYSDYDLPEFRNYLSSAIVRGLTDFIKMNTSIPTDIYMRHKSEDAALKEWNDIINKIIKAFEIIEQEREFEMSDEDKKAYMDGMDLFRVYIFDLWI